MVVRVLDRRDIDQVGPGAVAAGADGRVIGVIERLEPVGESAALAVEVPGGGVYQAAGTSLDLAQLLLAALPGKRRLPDLPLDEVKAPRAYAGSTEPSKGA